MHSEDLRIDSAFIVAALLFSIKRHYSNFQQKSFSTWTPFVESSSSQTISFDAKPFSEHSSATSITLSWEIVWLKSAERLSESENPLNCSWEISSSFTSTRHNYSRLTSVLYCLTASIWYVCCCRGSKCPAFHSRRSELRSPNSRYLTSEWHRTFQLYYTQI